MRIALVSLDQAWEDKVKNRVRVSEQVEEAVSAGAVLVVFPEMTLTGFTMNLGSAGEDPHDSETVKFFKNLAIDKITIAFGVVHVDAGQGTNKLIVVGQEGNFVASYTKIHSFSYAQENKYFRAGETPVFFGLNGLCIGLTICYDLRFPALYQALARNCDVIINIANWPERRLEHWDTLLRARAIENQVFMVGVNRTGVDGNGLKYERSSKVFGPSGKLIQPVFSDGLIDVVELDEAAVRETRTEFPVVSDRRDDLYAQFYRQSRKRSNGNPLQ
ncbi:MAG: nitrilase-related carbon-nitrogen hydrolase [Desulfomonile sp.]